MPMNLLEWPYYRIDFLASQGLSPTFVERFWSKVQITDGCWLWTASIDTRGYGHLLRVTHHLILAPRASWILHYGPIPIGFYVLHRCDVRLCVRPNHLFLGTQQDNMDDMVTKGRYRKGRIYIGSENPTAKLCEADVVEIRNAISKGIAQWRIAEAFGVSQMIISKISRGLVWAHVQAGQAKPS